jgi:hypothetical protein
MDPKLAAAALFLPLFPLTILFNILFEGVRHFAARIIVLLAWPQIGVWLIQQAEGPVPGWMAGLALATSLLYGFRAVVLRELIHWISFLAVSSWTLFWVAAGAFEGENTLALLAFGSSIPLVILVILGRHLEKQFGASYAGLYNGLGNTMPRFSGLLVFAILAVVATPVFPGFVTMTAAFLVTSSIGFWGTLNLCLICLTWAWAAARLIQGFVVGTSEHEETEDLSLATTWIHAAVLTGLAVFGILMMSQLS